MQRDRVRDGYCALSAHQNVKHTTAPYKYPRIVEFVSELPKTVGGKIKRAQLRHESGIED